jgi:elongation factor 1-gamma
VWKAQIAGKFTGLEIEAPAFQIGVDNKTPEFAAKFPLQKVPALETPEGPLFESNAIARYGSYPTRHNIICLSSVCRGV